MSFIIERQPHLTTSGFSTILNSGAVFLRQPICCCYGKEPCFSWKNKPNQDQVHCRSKEQKVDILTKNKKDVLVFLAKMPWRKSDEVVTFLVPKPCNISMILNLMI